MICWSLFSNKSGLSILAHQIIRFWRILNQYWHNIVFVKICFHNIVSKHHNLSTRSHWPVVTLLYVVCYCTWSARQLWTSHNALRGIISLGWISEMEFLCVRPQARVPPRKRLVCRIEGLESCHPLVGPQSGRTWDREEAWGRQAYFAALLDTSQPRSPCAFAGATHLSDPQFSQPQNILGLSEVNLLRLLACVLVSSQWESLANI